MNRLFEIASELGEIARKRYLLREEIRKFETSIKAAEVALIPEGGWPGTNDIQRKAAEATTKANDKSLQYLRHELEEDQSRQDKLEVDRQVLIDERDAWTWTIRDNEVAAIVGNDYSAFQMMKDHLQMTKEWEEYQAQERADQIRAQVQQETYDSLNQLRTEGIETSENANGDELDLLTQTHDDDPPF